MPRRKKRAKLAKPPPLRGWKYFTNDTTRFFTQLAKKAYSETVHDVWWPWTGLEEVDSSDDKTTVTALRQREVVSKFGGKPWESPKYPWPECESCKTKQILCAQLLFRDLPDTFQSQYKSCFPEGGLLQLFLCNPYPRDGECRTLRVIPDKELCENSQLFSLKSQSLAALQKAFPNKTPECLPQVLQEYFGPMKKEESDDKKEDNDEDDSVISEAVVYGWYSSKELPEILYELTEKASSLSEDQLGILPGNLEKIVSIINDNALSEAYVSYDNTSATRVKRRNTYRSGEIFPASYGVKLGGWLNWIIGHNNSCGVYYPTCPKCDIKATQPILQITRDDLVFDMDIGEGGIGFICACSNCKDMTFEWASI